MTAATDRQYLSTDQLLAQLVDAKMRQRQYQKAVDSIRAAKFCYQVIVDERFNIYLKETLTKI
jgi:hypothetical protein